MIINTTILTVHIIVGWCLPILREPWDLLLAVDSCGLLESRLAIESERKGPLCWPLTGVDGPISLGMGLKRLVKEASGALTGAGLLINKLPVGALLLGVAFPTTHKALG